MLVRPNNSQIMKSKANNHHLIEILLTKVIFLRYIIQKWNDIKIINILLVIIFFVLLLLTQFSTSQLFEAGYTSYAAIYIIGTLASVMLVIKAIRATGTISFNAIDLSFVAFALLLLLRWIDSDYSWIYSKAAIGFSLIPIYFFVKYFKSIYLIQWAIVFTGVFQIIIAILQKSGLLLNSNTYFVVGGTVGNPNVLAILLLFTILSAFYLLRTSHSPLLKNILVTYALMAFLLIVFTKCRTALFGSIFIGVFLFFRSNWISINRTTRLLWVSVLGVTCLGFVYLMIEKSGSMVGRLLIWHSCFVKIFEKPFWGHGISSFHQVYPEAQRIFLENNLNATYFKLADSPQWAYNDFIEFWLEGGIFTALAFLSVLVSVLYYWKVQKRFNINLNNISYLSVLLFFILSAFNFAYTAWPVLLVFVISLAWCARISINPIQIRLGGKINLWLIIALIFFSGNVLLGIDAGKNLLFQHQLKNADVLPLREQRDFYDRSHERYGLYAPFIFKYAAFLRHEGKKEEAIDALLRLNGHARSFQTSYLLAETYMEMYDIKNARVYYEDAIKYIPNRILPRYHLFMIELLDKNYIKADSIKKQTLRLDFKGDPLFINQIKESLGNYNINKEQINCINKNYY